MLELLTLVSVLGCGLVAGVFFAFSAFVMKALGNLPPPQGIAAMQSINVVVINPLFLTPFVGTAAVGVVMAIASVLRWHDPRASYWLAGSLLCVGGTFLVTRALHVPRNNALAAVAPHSPEAARLWAAAYVPAWTAGNHVRTIAALAAAAAFALALRFRA